MANSTWLPVPGRKGHPDRKSEKDSALRPVLGGSDVAQLHAAGAPGFHPRDDRPGLPMPRMACVRAPVTLQPGTVTTMSSEHLLPLRPSSRPPSTRVAALTDTCVPPLEAPGSQLSPLAVSFLTRQQAEVKGVPSPANPLEGRWLHQTELCPHAAESSQGLISPEHRGGPAPLGFPPPTPQPWLTAHGRRRHRRCPQRP